MAEEDARELVPGTHTLPGWLSVAVLLAILMIVYVRSAPDGLATPHPLAPPAPVVASRTVRP